MDLSVVIINYMTSGVTLNAIESVIRHTSGIHYEIILLDNASGSSDTDVLGEFIRKSSADIKLIKNQENIGFGKGNNQAAEMASGKYIVFFNSDCELTENTFKKSIDFMESEKDTGAVGPRIVTPDGRLDSGCRRGFPTPRASLYYLLGMHRISNKPKHNKYTLHHLDEFKSAEVDSVSGAFLFTRKSIFKEAGGFDGRYFMYGEDLDLCMSIKQLGYRIIYNPGLGNVIHYRGESGKRRKFRTLFNFYEAMILFYNKHYKAKSGFLVTTAVYTGIGLMFILRSITGIFTKR